MQCGTAATLYDPLTGYTHTHTHTHTHTCRPCSADSTIRRMNGPALMNSCICCHDVGQLGKFNISTRVHVQQHDLWRHSFWGHLTLWTADELSLIASLLRVGSNVWKGVYLSCNSNTHWVSLWASWRRGLCVHSQKEFNQELFAPHTHSHRSSQSFCILHFSFLTSTFDNFLQCDTHICGTAGQSVTSDNTHAKKALVEHTCMSHAQSESHPTFGVAGGGQDGARRAEEVRQITGKAFHLLHRCSPTGEERRVAAGLRIRTAAATASRRGTGGVRGRGSRSAAQGAMTASLYRSRGSRQAGGLRWNCAPPPGANSAQCQRTSHRFRVGGSLRGESCEERLSPLRTEVNVCGLPVQPPLTHTHTLCQIIGV